MNQQALEAASSAAATTLPPGAEGELVETIVGSAVRLDGVVWQLPRPARHHHVLWAIDQVLPGRAIEVGADSGFVTNTGRYIGRFEARDMARRNGQCQKPSHGSELFSEDLW